MPYHAPFFGYSVLESGIKLGTLHKGYGLSLKVHVKGNASLLIAGPQLAAKALGGTCASTSNPFT